MRKPAFLVLALMLVCGTIVSAATATVNMPVEANFPSYISLALQRVSGSPTGAVVTSAGGETKTYEGLSFSGTGQIPDATTYLYSQEYQTTVVCNSTWNLLVHLQNGALTSGAMTLPLEWQVDNGGGYAGYAAMTAVNTVFSGHARTPGTNALYKFRVNYSPIYEAGVYSSTLSFAASTP